MIKDFIIVFYLSYFVIQVSFFMFYKFIEWGSYGLAIITKKKIKVNFCIHVKNVYVETVLSLVWTSLWELTHSNRIINAVIRACRSLQLKTDSMGGLSVNTNETLYKIIAINKIQLLKERQGATEKPSFEKANVLSG